MKPVTKTILLKSRRKLTKTLTPLATPKEFSDALTDYVDKLNLFYKKPLV